MAVVSNRVIQSLWVGKFTAMEKLCVSSFLSNGHEFHLYTYGKLDGVPPGAIIKDANEIVPESKIKDFQCIQQFADYFRCKLLLKGGWWVDTDIICLKPFDFESEYVFQRDRENAIVATSVIKCPPNSPIMKYCCDLIEGMSKDELSSFSPFKNFQKIGPDLFDRIVPEFGLSEFIQPGITFDPIWYQNAPKVIDPTAKWDFSKSYSAHLFHAAWNNGAQAHTRPDFKNLTDSDGQYPEGCLYEQLKKKYLIPKVSIVITTFNRAPLLRSTLESFVSQSFKNYEVVIVDDGDDTETPKLCSESWPFLVRYFRIDRSRPTDFRNQSVVANFAIKQARGNIIILQNAECRHVGNVISDLVGAVTPSNVVLCQTDRLNPDGSFDKASTEWIDIARENQALFFCGAIYKSWFEKLRGFDEDYENCDCGDDNDFSHRLAASGVKFKFLKTKVQHQWHPLAGEVKPELKGSGIKLLSQKMSDMGSGKISPIRNLNREWGVLNKVSIVMTTFNRPTLLRNTLISIKQQKYRNAEIVVVDDGTDSETPNICKSHGVKYIKLDRPQSTIYRNPARPMNVGIRQASGNIIILQNAECKHVDPDTIEKLTSAVTDTNAVFAKVMSLEPDGRPDWLYCGVDNPRPFFFCGAIKKKWLEKLRGVDEEYPGGGYDDIDLSDRLAKEGVKFVFSDVEVHHQWHPHLGTLNEQPAKAMYLKKCEAMASGKLGTTRNLDREWGSLKESEPLLLPAPIPTTPPPCNCEDCRKKKPVPPPPPPPPPAPCDCPDCKKKRAGK